MTYLRIRTAHQCYFNGHELLHGPQAFLRDKRWVISEYEFGKLKCNNIKTVKAENIDGEMEQRVSDFFSSIAKKNICDLNTTEQEKKKQCNTVTRVDNVL